ncbi:MAG: TrfB-related DNA-binding protein [Candidatus Saccharibacteria bacterium]|nr:TrfB-related DNA-binding protein [Candidatus Saccharibacteria bacterium]
MNSPTYRLTESELLAVVATRQKNLTVDTISIARALMVDRKTVAEVMREFNKSRQRIYQIRNEFWLSYLYTIGIPADWKQITAIAPSELIDEFLDKIERAKKNL